MPTRILVVEDDDAIRESLSLVLVNRGYDVLAASNGAEGFAMFDELRPGVVLTDLIMPGHEGIETIARIRQLSSGVRIIAMSGSSFGRSDGFLEQARKAGADHCLEKPFEMADLFAALADLPEE